MYNQKNKNGFTLIELLVVIAIIGILSSFSVVSLNDARVKARDAKRKSDLVQVRLALSLYYDNNDEYPKCGNLTDDAEEATVDCYDNALATALTTGSRPYMSYMPVDPKDTGVYIYRYASSSIGDQFVLVYETEDSSDASPQLIQGW